MSRDPLQQLLIFVGLWIDLAEQMDDPFSGCLYASYCYQSGAISRDVMDTVEGMIGFWRRRLGNKVAEVHASYPPRIPVDIRHVTDHLLTTFEGAYTLAKLMKEPGVAVEQLIQCRNYLELLFSPMMDGKPAGVGRH